MKLKQLRRLMAENGLDGLLVSSPVNQSYISGADFHDGYIALTSRGCYACVDFRYVEAVKGAVSEGVEACLAEGSTLDLALDILISSGAKKIAFEGGELSYSLYKRISDKMSADTALLPSAGKLISSMRAIKSTEEIQGIANAQKITDAAFEHILKVMTPSMTEREVALELEFFMRRMGAEAMAFDVIAVSGSASSLPHGVPRDVRLERGFLTMDFGAKYNGYCSDMTRTVVIGKADEEIKKVYNTVLSAQLNALDGIHSGIVCRDADELARSIIRDAGYGEAFGHSLGHGVGMFIHESPRLAPRAPEDSRLVPGNVVTVEPGIYLEGRFGCRIEDMIAINEDGSIFNFTKSPKELIEI